MISDSIYIPFILVGGERSTRCRRPRVLSSSVVRAPSIAERMQFVEFSSVCYSSVLENTHMLAHIKFQLRCSQEVPVLTQTSRDHY